MKKLYFLFLLALSLGTKAQVVTADPAVGAMNIVDTMTNANRSNSITNSSVTLKLPVFNFSPYNGIPNGSTTLIINLGSKLALDPSFNLSTARLSNYFSFSYNTSASVPRIIGTQIAAIPKDFVDSTSFQVYGLAAGTSAASANFSINAGSNLDDEDGNNNSSSITYTVVGANGDFRSSGTPVDLNSNTNWEIYNGSSWVASNVAPNGNVSSGNTITIQPGHTWNNASAATIPLGVTLIHQGTTGTFSSTISLNGTYVHQTTSGVSAVLNSMNILTGSTFIYRGSSGATPSISVSGRTYHNLYFESTSGSYNASISGSNAFTVNGTLIVGGGVTLTGLSYTGALNFNGDITVGGTLNLNNVVLLSGKTLNIISAGKVVIPAGNKLVLNGAVTGTGTISGSTTSDLIVGGSGPLGTLYFDQTTDGSTNALDSITVNRNSEGMALGSKLNIYNTYIPMQGALASNGFLYLKSTATNTARVTPGPAFLQYITGNVTVERFIPASGRKFRLLSGSTTTGSQTIRQTWQENGVAVSGLGTWITKGASDAVSTGFDAQSVNNSILVWDNSTNSTNSWYNRLVDNTNTKTLSSEPGYMLFVRGDRTATAANSINNATTLRSTGTLKVGSETTTVVGAATGGNERYTLVGNPFASPIDFDQVLTNPSTTNIKPQFWAWDAKKAGVGGYVLVRKQSGIYYSVPAPFTTNDTATTTLQHIQSGQAFFVEPASGAGGSVLIEENDKSATTHTTLFRTAGSTDQNFRMNLYQDNAGATELADGIRVNFGADYSAGLDANDVAKLNNFNENLAVVRGSKNLIWESRPTVASQDTIFLNLTGTTQRNYQFAFKAENLNSSEVSAYLEDKYLKTVTAINLSDITTVNFSVTSDAASADANRFYVVFKANTTLPINFTTIKGARKDQSVKVEWSVATETNIASYDVEKSANGRDFSKAASVKATGFANYNWLDVTAGSGENYYRIKGISNSGVAIYSAIVKVNSITGKAGIVAYPNPLVGRTLSLQLTNQVAGRYNISLFNNIGQQVFSKSIEHNGGSSTQTIQLGQGITKGAYELKITNGENVTTQKIICN